MNKKAQSFGFMWASIGWAVAVLLIMYQAYYLDPVSRSEYAGATSTYLFNTHYDAQEKLNFVDLSARYGLYDTLRNLAWSAGFNQSTDRGCGSHVFNLWSNTTDKCLPNPSENLEQMFPPSFEAYLREISYPFPKDNYKYTYKYQEILEILGKAGNGLITQSEMNKVLFANYLVKPSFHITFDYNLDVYDKIKEWTTQTLENCYDNPLICLKQAVEANNQKYDPTSPFSFFLNTSCEENTLFYDFLESYSNCAWTTQSDCLCKVSTESKVKYNLQLEKGKIKVIEPFHQDFSVETPSAFGVFAGNQDPSPGHYTYTFGGEDKPVLKAYMTPEPGMPDRELYSLQPYDSLLLYKQKDGGMTLLQNGVYADGREVPFCTLNKTRVKICARLNQELPYIRLGEVAWKNITIQFALELQDRTPPPPLVEAKDKPSTTLQVSPPTAQDTSDGILVRWEKPQYDDRKALEDIDHYLLYCSQGPFADKPLPTHAFAFDDRKKVVYYTRQETVLISVLKKIGDEDTHTITLQGCGHEAIHDDLKLAEPLYTVYMTAVDKNGNEIKDITQKAEACPSSYYLEHPPDYDPTGTLMIEYEAYLVSVRQECWPTS